MIDAPKNKHRAPILPLNAGTLALTSFGLGFLRPAPGTWGSMPPAALAFVLMMLGSPALIRDASLGVLLLITSLACIAFGRYSESRFGRKDAAEVVADETAGQCIPLLLLPFESLVARLADPSRAHQLMVAAALCAAAFILFRTFDILKPWPARRLESLPHGWGILADDLIAGLYAAVSLQLAVWMV